MLTTVKLKECVMWFIVFWIFFKNDILEILAAES